jgi:hypothetical protein
LVGAFATPRENRHYDQPAVGQLIVPYYGVAVVMRLAGSTETLEKSIGRDRTIDDLPVLAKDRHARVDDLKNVVSSDGKRII